MLQGLPTLPIPLCACRATSGRLPLTTRPGRRPHGGEAPTPARPRHRPCKRRSARQSPGPSGRRTRRAVRKPAGPPREPEPRRAVRLLGDRHARPMGHGKAALAPRGAHSDRTHSPCSISCIAVWGNIWLSLSLSLLGGRLWCASSAAPAGLSPQFGPTQPAPLCMASSPLDGPVRQVSSGPRERPPRLSSPQLAPAPRSPRLGPGPTGDFHRLLDPAHHYSRLPARSVFVPDHPPHPPPGNGNGGACSCSRARSACGVPKLERVKRGLGLAVACRVSAWALSHHPQGWLGAKAEFGRDRYPLSELDSYTTVIDAKSIRRGAGPHLAIERLTSLASS